MTWEWTIFGIGCCGGIIPDVMRIIQSRYKAELPSYFSSWNFWLGLSLLVIIGGLAALLGKASDWRQALAIGYAGPEFLSRFLSSKPIELARPHFAAVLRRWWAF
jgi:hypothetical protein